MMIHAPTFASQSTRTSMLCLEPLSRSSSVPAALGETLAMSKTYEYLSLTVAALLLLSNFILQHIYIITVGLSLGN